MEYKFDVAVVGAGIVGLATAYAAACKGMKTIVFERNPRAIGASVRNSGLIWPIGQSAGPQLDRAMLSREIWLDIAKESSIVVKENGSIHLAYYEDELAVLQDFYKTAQTAGYQVKLLKPKEVAAHSPAVKTKGLKGGLLSTSECTVSPRLAIPQLAEYLQKELDVVFRFGSAVTHVDSGILSDFYDIWHAERIYISSGADFETLYPRVFRDTGITKCKMQMLRTISQPNDWQLGPSLCAGLSLLQHSSFAHLPSLAAVRERYLSENQDLIRYGIQAVLTQNLHGELMIGNSHQYGLDVSPFDSEPINALILSYLNTFSELPDVTIAETWHAVSSKLLGKTDFVTEVEQDVWIVNGLGSAGATMSFGLAKELV